MGRSESERKGYINLVRILRYMTGKDVAYLVLCVLLIAAQVYLDLRIPDYMSAITTEIEMVGGSFDNVVDDGYGMIFCALGSLASSIATGFIAAGLASTLCKRIRAKEFENVERFSEGDMNRFSTASLITRSTNDITQIQLFVAMGLQIIVKAPIMAVWAVLKIAGKSWQWSAITVAAVVAMLVIVACVMYFAIPRFKRIQWMTDDVNRVVRENLNGVRVVRAYNAEGYQEDKFGKVNGSLTENNLSAYHSLAFMMPSISSIMSFLTLGIYWVGALLIDASGTYSGKLGLFSDMVVFSSYAMQVVMAFIMMVIVFILGMFIDWLGIVMIVFPIFLPIMDQFGFDRLWLVAITAVLLQTCFMTPPFGFALFYVKGILPDTVKIQEVYKGVIPFILIIIVVTVLCAVFPQLVTWLPTTMAAGA